MNNEYRVITSYDGTPLNCLIRETGSSEWLIVTHGLGEHLQRHEYFLKLFSQNFNILLYDLRGHGKSGGRAAYVESFDQYSKDIESVLSYLVKEFNMTSYTLFGHSMGALITANFLQNVAKKNFYPQKVFLSAPPVGAPGLMGYVFDLTPNFIYETLGKLPTIPIGKVLDLKRLSHDERVYESYIKDPLNHLKVHTHLFFELLKTAREVFARPLRAECSLFVAIGTEDGLVNPKMLIDYFSKIEKNAALKKIDGGYHELHNEVEKYRKPYLNFLRQSLTGLSFE
ncbi:MAG: alpha/beta fold hydrolase [Bacteriovoracaceae bacterium]